MRRSILHILCAVLFVLASACSLTAKVKQYRVEVVKAYPHDVTSYTQGLFFAGGRMYESTGQYGSSTFRLVDLNTGKAERRLDFSKKYFVEGSCVLGDKLYILTWTNKVVFVYEFPSLEYEATFSYPRQGWGLTTDGKSLIASDGSSRVFYMDKNFRVTSTLNVTLHGRPLNYLNELEFIDGKIWANVYTSDMIVIINPLTGVVEGVVDCSGLLPVPLKTSSTDVLNGIAYNPETKKLYLTGKNWPELYEVRVVEKN